MKNNKAGMSLADLRDFMQIHNIKLKEQGVAEPNNTQSNPVDSLITFTEAMRGVNVLPRGKQRVMLKSRASHSLPSSESDEYQLLEKAIREKYTINVADLPEYMEGYVEGINPLTLEKLRKGTFSVEKTLDLHGYTVEDAKAVFQLFLSDAVKSGMHCIKVIHGRGLKSKDIPALKTSLKAWLVRAMHRRWVLAFCNAVMRDGGPGATYILLKKKPRKEHIRVVG